MAWALMVGGYGASFRGKTTGSGPPAERAAAFDEVCGPPQIVKGRGGFDELSRRAARRLRTEAIKSLPLKQKVAKAISHEP